MTCMCERLCRWNLWKSGGHGSKSGEEDMFLAVFRPLFLLGLGVGVELEYGFTSSR